MFDKKRKAKIERKTNEVDIRGKIDLDGHGAADIATGFSALDHLLILFSFHGLFDLELKAKGDLKHHIIEDIGIALGKSFKEALGSKERINRYGSFSAVMDKVLVEASLDISGRPSLYGWTLDKNNKGLSDIPDSEKFDDTSFGAAEAEDFLESFLQHSGISLVYLIKTSCGDLHHLLEALFKAMAKALAQAIEVDARRRGVPSTKGIID